ncbi:unnamed protein product [Cylicostephanus goldi]|uniref:Uncharacterized protein n=1 Tax=Cylicostephanus goldi TaxID=71465 RepID=A0A3P6S9Y3_CYLGO|nr:unnamed protein product [Cylicostephanus goldi]
MITETFRQGTQDTTQEATENSEEGSPSVLLLRGKIHIGNLSNPSLDNENTKKTVVATGSDVNELKRQAFSFAPLPSPISDNQPPVKRPPIAVANATLSKDKYLSSSPNSSLNVQSSIHSTTAKAQAKPAVLHSKRLYFLSSTDIIDDPFTKITAQSDVFATRPNLNLNVCALKNEGKTMHKAWEEFLELKEDVRRQQQDRLDAKNGPVLRNLQSLEHEEWNRRRSTRDPRK